MRDRARRSGRPDIGLRPARTILLCQVRLALHCPSPLDQLARQAHGPYIISSPCTRDPGLEWWRAMGCIFALIALLSPRLAVFLLWAFTNYVDRAFSGWFLPLLGIVFAPWTTLMY